MHTLFGNGIRKRLLPIIMASTLAACTSATNEGPVPSEGTLTIEPTDVTFSVGPAVGCLGAMDLHHT